ncbi:MAG: hypothetical protein MK538_18025 [Planctomycetes bacterium]|nr:hypothetical protein [Planctomycetota bacterium]
MTGGETIIGTLRMHGVDTVFGIPGAHNLTAYEALANTPEIRLIVTRHAQGASFMADGYSRSSSGVGVCLNTTGPGRTQHTRRAQHGLL